MSEPRFFKSARALTVGEIATLTGAELRAGGDPARTIDNIAPLDRAGAGDLTFLDSPKYVGELAVTRAGACLVGARFAPQVPPRVAALHTAEPYRAFVAVARVSAAGTVSMRATFHPCCAKTWAMPLPMVPAPITAARLMSVPFGSSAPPARQPR